MSGYKNGNTKIPMLKRSEYTHWEVKMLHHLEATDHDYLDRIYDGPFVPTKVVPQATIEGKVVEEHQVDKPKSGWTPQGMENVLKDAKVRNILFNSLDIVLTNYVLS